MSSFITFWKPNEDNGYLSNWYPCEFQYHNIIFKSSEQAFMYMKAELFGDEQSMKELINTSDPKLCKEIGRSVFPFDGSMWDRQKEHLMIDVNRYKFQQNPKLAKMLLATGDAILVEASPYDQVWGAGMTAQQINDPQTLCGKNLLGKALMKVREELANIPTFKKGN